MCPTEPENILAIEREEEEEEEEGGGGMWIDEIQKLNDREAKTALPLSALIAG